VIEHVVQGLLVSGLTLLVVGRVVGPARVTDRISRRTTCRELRRLRQLVEVCSISDPETATKAVAAALTEVLHLRDCWFEPTPLDPGIPELGPGGDVSVTVQRRGRGGLLLPDRVALPVRGSGRFVLRGHPTLGSTPEERLIASAMAAALPVPHTSKRQPGVGRPATPVGTLPLVEDLPGADLVHAGLADLRAGRATVPALVVAIAATRLRDLGIDVPDGIAEPEHRLWDLLAADDPDSAHSRYNALVQRIVSFERALACVA
jgi:hypothetical protein